MTTSRLTTSRFWVGVEPAERIPSRRPRRSPGGGDRRDPVPNSTCRIARRR
ncbi:hypothetical protein ACVBEQ_25730 [Nakamurella sp. GG22]